MDEKEKAESPITREQAIELLKGGSKGIEEWNRLRADCLEIPDLDKVDLQKADLIGANLSGANLNEANLSGVELSNANLSGANLFRANLSGATLYNAERLGVLRAYAANLSGANLIGANLSGATLFRANLSGTKLFGANLSGTKLIKANLSGAELEKTDLSGAVLKEAKLSNKVDALTEINLSNANMRGIGVGRFWHMVWPFYRVPFVLDRTHIRDTIFEPRVADPWSVLRRSYTGPKFAFLLLFTLAAFLPLVAQAIFWISVARLEQHALPLAIMAVKKSADVLRDLPDPAWTAWVERADRFLQQHETRLLQQRQSPTLADVQTTLRLLRGAADAIVAAKARTKIAAEQLRKLKDAEDWVTRARELVRTVRPGEPANLRERWVVELLLGFDRGLATTLLYSLLLLYNAARAFLTYNVGPLRDAEERCGDSPAWTDYRLYWRLHKWSTLLLSFAVGYGLYRLWAALFTTVIVPV